MLPQQLGDYCKTARAMGPILAGPGPQRWPLVPRGAQERAPLARATDGARWVCTCAEVSYFLRRHPSPTPSPASKDQISRVVGSGIWTRVAVDVPPARDSI
jgi:hypothetical protein